MDLDFAATDPWSEEEVARFKQQVSAPMAAAAEARQSLLVAEGDSWFDYLPGADIIPPQS